MNRHRLGLVAALSLAPSALAGGERLIVLNKAEARAVIFEGDAPTPAVTLAVGDGPHEVAISPDGSTAVVSNYGGPTPGSTLTVLDLSGKAEPRTIALGDYRRPHGLAYFPDGKHVLVTAEINQSIVKVNIPEGRIAGAWETGAKGSHMVVLAPGASTAYVTNVHDGSATKVDLTRPPKEAAITVPTAAGAEGLSLSPDGKELWVANNQADTISIIDTATFKVVDTVPCKSFPIRVCFTPDGKRALASSAKTGEIAIFDVKGRAETNRISMVPGAGSGVTTDPLPPNGPFAGSSVPIGIVITPDSARAYIASTATGTIATLDLKTSQVSAQRRAGKNPDGIGLVTAAIPKVTPAGTR